MFKLALAGALLALGMQAAMAGDEAGRTEIHPQAEEVQPLLPGMRPPVFNLRSAAGAPVTFDPDDLERPIILTFFRGGWCPYCNLYLSELRHAEAELKSLGFDLWFISVDRPELLYESLKEPDIGYTVYSDAELEASRGFGIAFRVDDALLDRYRDLGIDLEAASGKTHHVLPAPSTFLIGTDGVIHFQYTNPDYKVRLHPDILMAAARVYLRDQMRRLEREHQKSTRSGRGR